MKRLLVGLVAFGMLAGVAQAAFIDNFDSYPNQAALDASWTPNVTAMTLKSDLSVSAPNSIYQDTVAQQSYKNLGADSVVLRNVDFSFDFYDGGAALGRTYGMVYSRGAAPDAPWTDGLNQILAIGKNNGLTTTKYSGRIAFGSLNWFNLDAPTSPNRSVGWHTMRIQGDGALAPTLTFFVDGLVGKTVTLTEDRGNVLINYAVMGSGLSSVTTANYDNVSVVPDPATLALISVGGLFLRRRRR